MIDLVDSVADLTALRDREELEIIMAMAASDLLGVSVSKLWRLATHSGELRLHERAWLADRRVTISDMPADTSDLPTLASHRELHECYDKKIPLPIGPDADGRHRHIFPIVSPGGVVGFLDVCRAAPLNDDQRRLTSGLLRIYQNQIETLNYCESDELTGLLNRKTFDASFGLLARIAAPARAGMAPFERIERRRPVNPNEPRWLAVLDIDFFKRINDRHGHVRGDEVLVAVAQLMRNSFRQADRLFRCGGEEFMIILEPTAARFVGGVLERFRMVVQAYDFPQVGEVTMSIGFTDIRPDDTGLAAFRRADAALYAAKHGGRNQVICYEELPFGGAQAKPTRVLAARSR
jgi:diguanylate cyclase (GGDEF)-like protein